MEIWSNNNFYGQRFCKGIWNCYVGKFITFWESEKIKTKANTNCIAINHQSVQSLSHVRLFVTPWTAARQASLSITNSRSLLKGMSIVLVMPSNHLNELISVYSVRVIQFDSFACSCPVFPILFINEGVSFSLYCFTSFVVD